MNLVFILFEAFATILSSLLSSPFSVTDRCKSARQTCWEQVLATLEQNSKCTYLATPSMEDLPVGNPTCATIAPRVCVCPTVRRQLDQPTSVADSHYHCSWCGNISVVPTIDTQLLLWCGYVCSIPWTQSRPCVAAWDRHGRCECSPNNRPSSPCETVALV